MGSSILGTARHNNISQPSSESATSAGLRTYSGHPLSEIEALTKASLFPAPTRFVVIGTRDEICKEANSGCFDCLFGFSIRIGFSKILTFHSTKSTGLGTHSANIREHAEVLPLVRLTRKIGAFVSAGVFFSFRRCMGIRRWRGTLALRDVTTICYRLISIRTSQNPGTHDRSNLK